MLRTIGLVTAAALLASVTAFAQSTNSGAPAAPTAAPAAPAAPAAAPASSDSSAAPADTAEKPHHRHHHHHMAREGQSASTDYNADKLNACMSNATPTADQESCLKNAANS